MVKAGDPDGFGRFGHLEEDDESRVLCHECGRWLRAMASHLARKHGMSTEQYRAAHGLARTVPLAGLRTRERLHASGIRRRDSDPRVLAALTGLQARVQRASPFPHPQPRPSAVARSRDAKRVAGEAHLQSRLAAAGWEDLAQAVAWAREHELGWSALARRLGMSHTPLQRRGQALGLNLPAVLPAQAHVTRMLELARAHHATHGSLNATTGELARWLTKRRFMAQRETTRRPTSAALDAIDPSWRRPRRSSA